MSDMKSTTKRIKALTLQAGFDRVGIAPAGPYPEAAHFEEWLRRGYHGEMTYLEKTPERRADVRVLRQWCKSVIVATVGYHTDHPLSLDVPDDPERGWISRYAWGRDYHAVIEKRLKGLVRSLDNELEAPGQFRYYVDHGPVLERVVARHAGLGWIGKNTLLIHPQHGSWFFLAVILTDLELEPDGLVADHCGSCTRCIDACPTDAFVQPYVLDATRCISYLTIEQKAAIEASDREEVGFHLFGCDICQDVCPWNGFATPTDDPAFQPREGLVHPRLSSLADLDEDEFRSRFSKNPVKRRKYAGLMSNVESAQSRVGEGNIPAVDSARALRTRKMSPDPTGG